ncbi:MAG: hypothetical protein R6T83_06870 [Salinibacter sp.]
MSTTLDRMQRGGMYDQVGFGFHRYSTDPRWVLPHFEKMLYDQAMHVLAYTEAYQVTETERYRRTAEEVIAYVRRDLQAPEGGFYSAEDADSRSEEGTMEEGAFYVWSVERVRELLDADAADLVIDVYNMRPEGNYQEEGTGQRTGQNVLHRKRSLEAEAERQGMAPQALRERLLDARRTLRAHREERSRPALDDKVLTDWNGLMIAALATAGRAFEEPTYDAAAEEAASFFLNTMQDDAGRLLHRYRNGEADIPAQLDDYAFLIWGLIELYETTFDPAWLEAALRHMEVCLNRFWDEERGGFYLTADDAEDLIVRPKEGADGALPSGNSVQLLNLLRLSRMTGRPEFEERANALARWGGRQARTRPTGATALLMGLEFVQGPSREVVVAGQRTAEDTQALIKALRSVYRPSTVVLHRPPEERADIIDIAPFTRAQKPIDGDAAAYVCRDFRCEAPTTNPDTLRSQLGRAGEEE